MTRFNIAYCPTREDFAKTCIEVANRVFGAYADGYLLDGAKILPCITLCEVEMPDARLAEVWQHTRSKGPSIRSFRFRRIALRPDQDVETNFAWAEILADRSPDLVRHQSKISDVLSRLDLVPLTKTNDDYSPHMAFARMTAPGVIKDAGMLAEVIHDLSRKPHEFQLTVGLSDNNGGYSKRMYPEGPKFRLG